VIHYVASVCQFKGLEIGGDISQMHAELISVLLVQDF
jgi:hypothetical protein